MKSKVYIETTIVSYLVASPTKDLIQSAHQENTRQWWAGRTRFDLFVSRTVGAEARRGDVRAAARRVAALRGIPRLSLRREAVQLANATIRGKIEDVVRDAGMVPPIICTPEELTEFKP